MDEVDLKRELILYMSIKVALMNVNDEVKIHVTIIYICDRIWENQPYCHN